MWWIFIILGLIVAIALFWIGLAKQKNGEVLTIFEDNDKIELFLTDDNYLTIDISDIKNNNSEINNRLKEVIKSRAFELNNLVTKVSFVQKDNKTFANELLNVIQQ